MAVRITAKFDARDIEKMFLEKMRKIDQVILTRLIFIAEKFVKNARSKGAYTDQTGNLRSSIGYIILKDGSEIRSDFERSMKTSGGKRRKRNYGKDGIKVAKELIEEIKSNFPKGYVLIVVAGMDYAAAVEAKGYDVITSSAEIAVDDLNRAMKELKSKIDRIR